jgi:hypothetical protein
MATQQSMIQVSGTTYRVRSRGDLHQVFRVSDDRCLGIFEHRPVLRVLESESAPEQLLEVARAALRSARLPWLPARRPGASNGITSERRARPSRALAALLFALQKLLGLALRHRAQRRWLEPCSTPRVLPPISTGFSLRLR